MQLFLSLENLEAIAEWFVIFQSVSHVWLFVISYTATCKVPLSFTISQSVLKVMSTESMMLSNHLILCHSLFIFPCLSQHQGLFQWVSSSPPGGQSIGASASASVFPMNIQWWFPLVLTGLISLLSKWLSRVFSNTTIQKYQFFSTQISLWSNSHICTWILEKPELWLYGLWFTKWYLYFSICCLALL